MYRKKFERAASSRRAFAFWMALGLHLAALAAIIYFAEMGSYLPDFVYKLFTGTEMTTPPAVP